MSGPASGPRAAGLPSHRLEILTLASLVCLLPAPAVGQGGARLLHTVDEQSGAADTRVIVQSLDFGPPAPDEAGDQYHGAALILACGNRLPGDSGRTLLLFAGEPLEPSGGVSASLEVRLGDAKWERRRVTLLERDRFAALNLSTRNNWAIAFLGSKANPYYDPALVAELLRADTLRVRYTAYSTARSMAFPVRQLRSLADSAPECGWPSR